MNWQRGHSAAKSVFLSASEWREDNLTRVKNQLKQFVLREVNSWSTGIEMPLDDRLQNWRDGFLSKSAFVYDFESYEREAFLSDYQREKTAYINESQFTQVLMNKIGFFMAMERFDEHRPELFGVLDGGKLHPISPAVTDRLGVSGGDIPGSENSGAAIESYGSDGTTLVTGTGRDTVDTVDAANWIFDKLEQGDQLVLKPAHAAGGTGVKHCWSRNGTVRMNGNRLTRSQLRDEIASLRNNIVMEYVEQAEYSDELYSNSTNTIRMMTMWDSETEEVFCPVAVHRIGTGHSAPVDNFGSYGISAPVDLETGEMGSGVQLTPDGEVQWHDIHPETDAEIDGNSVPGWQTIRDRVLDIADAFSYVPYVGWDVVVTAPGEFVLLEANNCPDFKMVQAHGPLLTDDRVKRFYANHGVCSA